MRLLRVEGGEVMEVESRSAAESCKKKLEMFIVKSSDVKEKNLPQISFGRQSLRLSGDDKIEKLNFEPQKVVGARKRIERETTNATDVHCGPLESNTGKKEKCYVTSIGSEMRTALQREENFQLIVGTRRL